MAPPAMVRAAKPVVSILRIRTSNALFKILAVRGGFSGFGLMKASIGHAP
jgi:hypothetical protein